jgi:glycerophosphoryl diester phosphodiesterase
MHPYLDTARPHLFAHRGASGEAPENTMPAFERAVASGVPLLEMDCHASADGEIVICHDALLDRTTDVSGPLKERSFAELERIDAGYRFTPDGGESHPFRGKGVRMPRLAEVLASFPGIRINLEIKQGGPPIAAEVLRLIRDANAGERVLLAAESDEIMAEIRALEPETATGSSLGDAVAFFRAIADDLLADFEPAGDALQIPSHFGADPLVTEQSVAAARQVGIAMHIWTINDPAEMRALLAAGVDGVMSDFPGRLVAEARAHAAGA